MQWEWLIPFQGRNKSSWHEVNFVCRHEDVYVMDNHRVALWCWLQHLGPEERHHIVHIDQHYDMGAVGEDVLDGDPGRIRNATLADYLELPHSSRVPEIKAFDWGNYLSGHFMLSRPLVTGVTMSTWQVGSEWREPTPAIVEVPPAGLPQGLEAPGTGERLIINIDVDINHRPDPTLTQESMRALDDEHLHRIGQWVAERRGEGVVAATTIALSPECAGGWSSGEASVAALLEGMGMNWALPE